MPYQAGLIPPHICFCHSPRLGKPLAYVVAVCALNDLNFNILVYMTV